MTTNYNLFIYAACFSIFFIHSFISKQNRSNRLFDEKGRLAIDQSSLIELYSIGIILLALVPVAMVKNPLALIFIPGLLPTTLQVFVFILLLPFFVFAGNKASPQISSVKEKDDMFFKTFLGYYFPMRILFIAAYEIFFRGFLLFDLGEWFGIPLAIAFSTGLTVMLHVFNSKKEMWACIPFGIILCGGCYWFHSVWPAVIFHIALCTSYEITFVHQFFSKLKPVK